MWRPRPKVVPGEARWRTGPEIVLFYNIHWNCDFYERLHPKSSDCAAFLVKGSPNGALRRQNLKFTSFSDTCRFHAPRVDQHSDSAKLCNNPAERPAHICL